MANLSNLLSSLANPTPVFQDPEDVNDDTGARLTEKYHDDNEDVLPSSSKLRKQTASLLADTDTKYAGKKTSRKKLSKEMAIPTSVDDSEDDDVDDDDEAQEEDAAEESDDIMTSGDDRKDGDDDDDDDDGEGDEDDLADFKEKMKLHDSRNKQEFSFEDDGDYSKFADDEEDEDTEDEAGSSDEEDEEEDEDEDMEEDDSEDEEDASPRRKHKTTGDEEDSESEEPGVTSFSKTGAAAEIQKGKAAKAQLGLWDKILKSRIELQKLLSITNQLPQPDTWDSFVSLGGQDYVNAVKEGQSSLKKVLDQLVQLQTALLLQTPETKVTIETTKKTKGKEEPKAKSNDDMDEEITSESDVEEEEDEEEENQRRQLLKRKIKMADYPDYLAKRHKDFQQYRNNTIQKWHDKTRVATGKLTKGFSAFEQSTLTQIQQILSDQDRLIKRTQLKRSVYQVLGKVEEDKQGTEDTETEVQQNPLSSRDHLKNYDAEIFDDDDFYHQLLREIIERKVTDTNDPVALSRQWLEIQKLRKKVKKVVDQKASKGRKIRYDVMSKLVNFMAPVDTGSWTEEARNDLFSSLFGKRQSKEEVVEDR